jgi:hypothetical protein
LDDFFPEPSKSIVVGRIQQYRAKEEIDEERAYITGQIMELLQPGINMENFHEQVGRLFNCV